MSRPLNGEDKAIIVHIVTIEEQLLETESGDKNHHEEDQTSAQFTF